MARVSVEAQIHEAMGRLTNAEKRAARALISNYPTLGLAPVAEFAHDAGASAATVLRFIAQLGFESYPDFQRRLREELEERIKSPLQKASPRLESGKEQFLPRFANKLVENINETVARLPASEFSGLCAMLAAGRGGCHIAGGRFTGPIAAYLTAHLRIVRPDVRLLDSRPATRHDELLDVKPNDVAIIFDIRRYDDDLTQLAQLLKTRRARIALITDEWISPAARYAKFVIPCSVDVGHTWDSSAALFAIAEAMISRVTDLSWKDSQTRIAEKETFERG